MCIYICMYDINVRIVLIACYTVMQMDNESSRWRGLISMYVISMWTCVYMYIYIHTYIHIYIHTYIITHSIDCLLSSYHADGQQIESVERPYKFITFGEKMHTCMHT